MFINFATGWTLPPFWLNHPVHVLKEDEAWKMTQAELTGNLYQCPLRLKLKTDPESAMWTLPFDPVISIQGGKDVRC